jgi:hypothetical protein
MPAESTDRTQTRPQGASENVEAPEPYTMIPNVLIDEWMPILRPAELRVLLYIARRTYGFHRRDVEIGERLIADGRNGKDRGTGLHLGTVSEATNSLIQRGLIRVKNGARGRRTYEINVAAERTERSEIPNSDRSDSPNSDRSEIANTNKRKSSSKKEERKNTGERHRKADPKPLLSSKTDDDEKPSAQPRERLLDPKREFEARLNERHGDRIDSLRTCELVSIGLADLGLTLDQKFLDYEATTTTNPRGLHNPIGHYRRLPKKFSNEFALNTIEEHFAFRAPISVTDSHQRCEACKGFGRLNFPDGAYCACTMGSELRRADEALARDREKADLAAAKAAQNSMPGGDERVSSVGEV